MLRKLMMVALLAGGAATAVAVAAAPAAGQKAEASKPAGKVKHHRHPVRKSKPKAAKPKSLGPA